jgi:hypothetical protein
LTGTAKAVVIEKGAAGKKTGRLPAAQGGILTFFLVRGGDYEGAC